MLNVGDRFPAFDLPVRKQGSDGKLKLRDLLGGRFIVYFYPKDDTPGCTRQAQAFEAHAKTLRALKVAVVGVSRDALPRHAKFQEKYQLNFALVSDEARTLHEACGAWGTKNLYGKLTEGAIRSTFVVSAEGIVEAAYPKVSVDGHVEKVVAFLKGEASAKSARATKTAATMSAKTAASAKATTSAKQKKPKARAAATKKSPR
jgi:thioredoxin-dependent peroxiredoxin